MASSIALAWNTKTHFTDNLRSNTVGNKFGQFSNSKNSMKNVAWKLKIFQKFLRKKESEDICMLIWTNFNSLAITYLK